jgi:hypothetical protein
MMSLVRPGGWVLVRIDTNFEFAASVQVLEGLDDQ